MADLTGLTAGAAGAWWEGLSGGVGSPDQGGGRHPGPRSEPDQPQGPDSQLHLWGRAAELAAPSLHLSNESGG